MKPGNPKVILRKASEKKEQQSHEKPLMIAKKNFTIVQNDYVCVIKVGDNLINVPERFHANLKTEGIID
jgi:hypothetical protein